MATHCPECGFAILSGFCINSDCINSFETWKKQSASRVKDARNKRDDTSEDWYNNGGAIHPDEKD